MDRRSWIKAVGLAPLAATPLVGAAADDAMPALGAPLPLPDVPLLDGSLFRAAEAQRAVVVVYWWASWCPFCALMTPSVQALWEAQRSRGLRVLGLSIDQRPDDARRYMAQRRYTFPTGFHTPEVARVLPKPKGLPVTCVRGKDGRVVMAEAGQLFPEDVEQIARFL